MSHICSFTLLPSSSIVRILKSMPIVVMKEGVKESSLNRRRQHDLPTPESPIKRSLICCSLIWYVPDELVESPGVQNSQESRNYEFQPYLISRSNRTVNSSNGSRLALVYSFRDGLQRLASVCMDGIESKGRGGVSVSRWPH